MLTYIIYLKLKRKISIKILKQIFPLFPKRIKLMDDNIENLYLEEDGVYGK